MKKNVLDGFTLIELMVVILIIGILASISIPSFMQSMEFSRQKEATTTLQLIYNAEKIYRLDKAPHCYTSNFVNMASYIENPNLTADYYNYAIAAAGASPQIFTATGTRKGKPSKTVNIDNTGATWTTQ
jgi:prepilin-type N-terminal cleavage/methylation domain-containing protein